MHERVKEKFFGTILAYLRSCRVTEERRFVSGDAAHLIRLYSLEHEYLHRWVSEAATIHETIDRTQALLSTSNGNRKEGKEASLEAVIGREALERHAKQISDFLASIPYESTFWAHLRGVRLTLEEPIEVGALRLRNVGSDYATPKNLLAKALLATEPNYSYELAADDVVLEVVVRGYSSGNINDSAPTEALSLTKEFLVLAEALEVLRINTNDTGKWTKPTPLLCEIANTENTIKWVENVPRTTCYHVDRYNVHEAMRWNPAGLLSPTGESSDTEVATKVRERLLPLASIFHPELDKHVKSLRTAAQWYFDSLAENNETTSFIFVSLGLEALLGGDRGETEGLGLKKLLANRIAYLLGKNRLARNELIRDFQDFYDKRSALVHGRELRLNRENKKWLLQGRTWLRQAIAQELRSLIYD